MTPEILVEEVKKFLINPPSLGEEEKGAYEDFREEWMSAFGDIIDKYCQPQETRTGEAALSPSSLGKCVRALAYNYHGIPGVSHSYKTKMTFLTGDLLELVFYMLADAVGSPVENAQARVDLNGIKGSIDGEIRETLVDI